MSMDAMRRMQECRMAMAAPLLPAAATIWLIAFGVVGCGRGSDALSGTVPVSGMVLVAGKPLAQGTIRFAPDSGGQPATSAVVDGRFDMRTTASSPGVLRGRYRVTVVSERVESSPSVSADVPPDPKNLPVPESLIPRRYSDVRTSGLAVEVTAPVAELSFTLDDK